MAAVLHAGQSSKWIRQFPIELVYAHFSQSALHLVVMAVQFIFWLYNAVPKNLRLDMCLQLAPNQA
jgi:hypothetical protein